MKAFFINKLPLFLKPKARQRGQVIVEYILLLVASTAIALLLIKLVSVETGAPFFNYWEHILKAIGQDISS